MRFKEETDEFRTLPKKTLIRDCPYLFLPSNDGVTYYASHAVQVQKSLFLMVDRNQYKLLIIYGGLWMTSQYPFNLDKFMLKHSIECSQYL